LDSKRSCPFFAEHRLAGTNQQYCLFIKVVFGDRGEEKQSGATDEGFLSQEWLERVERVLLERQNRGIQYVPVQDSVGYSKKMRGKK
jgi:hypothetical protein